MVTSRRNSLVRFARSLHLRKYREESGRFFCEGVNAVEALLRSDWKVEHILGTPRTIESFAESARDRGAQLTVVSEDLASFIADAKSTQGIFAIAPMRRATVSSLTRDRSSLIVLDGISDPGNVGTIIRLADGFGCRGVVLIAEGADPYNSKTIRASAGSLFHLTVVESGAQDFVAWAGANRLRLLVASARGGRPPWEVDLTAPVAIALGHERRGLSATLANAAEAAITIPLPGRAESLNVAVAAGIILAEAARQRAAL